MACPHSAIWDGIAWVADMPRRVPTGGVAKVAIWGLMCKRWEVVAQAVAEVGVAAGWGGVVDGGADGLVIADEYAEAAGAAYACVEEVAVEHRAV